jgi:hypothetical protein
MKRYMICIPQQTSYGYQEGDEKDMWTDGKCGKMHIGFDRETWKKQVP